MGFREELESGREAFGHLIRVWHERNGWSQRVLPALAELFTAGRSWRQCRESVLAAYPVEKRQRRERFAEVMAGQRDFSAAELDAELPDLRRTLALLGAAAEQELGADQFLELLRQKARLLEQSGLEGGVDGLAEAIRRELQVERPGG